MKKTILKTVLIGAIAFTSVNTFAKKNDDMSIRVHDDKITKTFKVYGNCGMCEETIEGSLKDVKGIEKADWNKDTKMMEVTYHEHQITLDEIKKKIAGVGYDTDEFRSKNKTYNNLPGCCQYDRPESK